MKLVIFGAAGNCGQRLARFALEAGHEVTAFVRDSNKLNAQLGGDPLAGLNVITGDICDAPAVARAIEGHDAVINAAGNVADGSAFVQLVDTVVTQTQEVLGSGGRLWLFGGAAALTVPGTNVMGADLPLVPPIYRNHKLNFERALKSDLDFSFICPGPMVASADGKARTDLQISVDEWPFPRPWYTFGTPGAALSLALMRHISEMTVSYEDVARFVIDHIAPGGRFSRHRIGLARP